MINKIKLNNDTYFIRLINKNVYFWYYLAVNKAKLPFFKKLEAGNNINLKDYGEILDSGIGLIPPTSVAEKYPDIKLN